DPWSSSEADKKAKEEKEALATKQIASEYVEFNELLDLLHAYHERRDEECKFVYALDKIQPVVNIYLDGGDFYRTYGVTIERWIKHNTDKIADSKFVVPYFED